MKETVNQDEPIGKAVGRSYSSADYDRLAAPSRQVMGSLPFPKGVFRFRTFEEADAWIEKHMMAAAVKKLRDRQNEFGKRGE